MSDSDFSGLSQLGGHSERPASPEAAVIEKVPNPHPDHAYVARFTCPDFAHLVIDYIPGAWLVESKSLKLYLGAFRDHAAFHEGCTVGIARRLADELTPLWLRIAGYWYPRGGIPIDVFYQTGAPPEGVWIPDPGVAPYRGRG
jgi:7-cyano-7-deazaguanine reductase